MYVSFLLFAFSSIYNLMLYAEQAAAHQLHISIFPKHYPLLSRLYKPPILETARHKYWQNTLIGHYNPIFITSLSLSNCTVHTHLQITCHHPLLQSVYCVLYCNGVHQLPSQNLRPSRHSQSSASAPEGGHFKPAIHKKSSLTELTVFGTFLLNFHRRLS